MDREGKFGFSIGGGIQYFKTELFGLKDTYKELGVVRELQRVYVGQIGYGFGLSGFTAHGFLRYGHHSDTKSNTISIGLQYDFNLPMLKKIADPASAL